MAAGFRSPSPPTSAHTKNPVLLRLLHSSFTPAPTLGDLLDADLAIVQPDTLYRCLDKLVEHKDALFGFLTGRWRSLFGASHEVLLYDLTSTYFECEAPEQGKRRFGYSRDKRSDCVQGLIALIVTPEGELYILAKSDGRVGKERSMRRRRLKRLLRQLQEMQRSRDDASIPGCPRWPAQTAGAHVGRRMGRAKRRAWLELSADDRFSGGSRESYLFRQAIKPIGILSPSFNVDAATSDELRKEQQRVVDGGFRTMTPLNCSKPTTSFTRP